MVVQDQVDQALAQETVYLEVTNVLLGPFLHLFESSRQLSQCLKGFLDFPRVLILCVSKEEIHRLRHHLRILQAD